MLRDPSFQANSVLFTKDQRNAVIMSNIGIMAMIWAVNQACAIWGPAQVIKLYGIPWFCVSHWCVPSPNRDETEYFSED